MRKLKKILRLCSLVLFMTLAVTGIGILGVAPTLTKDRKLFPDITINVENPESDNTNKPQDELLKS
jgi:hypothetical protein